MARERAGTAQRGGAIAAAGGWAGGSGGGAPALPQAESAGPDTGPGMPGPYRGSLAERADSFEREQILAELKRHNQRMSDTAKALGLERSHLYKKCQALGIDLRALRKGADA